MYYFGSFINHNGDTVTVHIVTNNDRSEQVEIGTEESGMFFTDDPVSIDHSVNDTFDHLLCSSASIRLLTREFVADFFCRTSMDAVVNIYNGDRCVFAGFIEPQAYSQSFNEVYDELELSCIDALSALQYSSYGGIGQSGKDYSQVRANVTMRSFYDIIKEMLHTVCRDMDIIGHSDPVCLYDGSKAIDSDTSNRYSIFRQLSISELLFLGDEENDVWKLDSVLEEMLRYLNLHIVQDGFTFYIFSWETIVTGHSTAWADMDGTSAYIGHRTVSIGLDNVTDTDTNISIGEVYNKLVLTCDIKSIENLIESPLEDDQLKSPYSNRQKYMTEYSSDGEGVRAYRAFKAMTHDEDTDYEDGKITDWYIQVKNNPAWIFPENGTGADLVETYCKDNMHQEALPNIMPEKPAAAIVAFGKVEEETKHTDNSPVSRIDMTNYLAISVNGNRVDNDEKLTYPNEQSIKEAVPCAVYNGGAPGAVYSPSDKGTTNYIVLSGDVVLNPIMDFTAPYKTLHEDKEWNAGTPALPAYMYDTVPSRNNDDGRYYTQKYYKALSPGMEEEWDADTARGLIPFTNTGPQEYEFKYSAVGDGTDKISKVSVLACMLVIGDKCVVETGSQGQTDNFEWVPYKTRGQCTSDDEYFAQCFTIGFDPKIGDKLIGTEFKLQNNIDYKMGIDAEGIAIPVKQSDKLSGPVRFMILGPVNVTWSEVTRRHPTFFRHTKWGENTVPLMAHVSTIYLKSFEMKIYSDNGLINNTEDCDLVYMSATDESFVNPKDNIKFKISSALTAEECKALGFTDTVKLSTPLDSVTQQGVLSIFDSVTGQQAKPEQLYVDSYYKEYSSPRLELSQSLADRSDTVKLFNHYRHPAMDKEFYVIGISRNLMEGTAKLTLKEIWH